MRLITKTRPLAALLLGFMFAVSGCGGSSNNQGTSFTFLGWFQSAPASSGSAGAQQQLPPGLTGVDMILNSRQEPDAARPGGQILAYAGVENNLAGEIITTKRIFSTFYIEGATVQPPPTSLAFGTVMGPAVVASSTGASTGFETTLPPAFAGLPNRQFGQTIPVPAEIIEWLNFNRRYLPRFPLNMTVTSFIRGVTSSGTVLDSNEIVLPVIVLSDVIIGPSGGVAPTATTPTSGTTPAPGG